ncbi:sugar phosphate isomerase/epimerase [Sphingomonas parva]|uniref:Sugar phosphate isomerase/epimerase n=1 Tax=Sphingomonas parva TaxID=2555898 RepID=A0A4Y8ZQA4_9SPHN|nr:sugar phosphate isomerase/epimerase [Sphingomonas parva]TFI56576.1 sugar phosphate isomerase/epimerase [Sphingomonas parva]
MSSLTRRAMLGHSGLLAAAAMLPAGRAFARPLPAPLGLQLWTVKDELKKDFDGTLRALGKLGYKRIEAAGWYDRTARQFRESLRAAGLECTSAHHGLQDLIDNTDARLAFAREVGARYVVASSPAPRRPISGGKDWNVALAEAMSLADWQANAEAMNRIGERARAMGLRFGYHNHAAEFVAYERKLPIDEIVRLTDPRNVVLELDLGWVWGAGYDPAETIRRYAPRVHLLHIKDMTAPSRTPGRIADARSTVVGEGMIDWKSVFEATRRAPIHSIFVEQEDPFSEPPLQALEKSAAYLRTLSA